jgi:capsular exopolysaccharide synthesis family protein
MPVVAEAFNQLRTSLLLSNAGGAPQTVLVASGQPFEGKTITSLNLAKSLAQLGERVLLIDADLRSPKMHLLHDLSNKKGLSSLLTVKSLDDENINGTIQRDIDVNLDLLTSGPKVPNPSNLFSSPEMRSLLERFSRHYTYVVIDSPPILYFADSVILANSVDAVVIMARANVSSREILLRAKKVLQDVRANVIGLVMNDVPLGSFKYYNNKYYRQLEDAEVEGASANVLHLD